MIFKIGIAKLQRVKKKPIKLMTMKKLVAVVTLIIYSFTGYSQIVGGDISYKTLGSLLYEITIELYVKDTVDYNQIVINWGDNTSDTLMTTENISLPDNFMKWKYTGEHSYPGLGSYEVTSEIPYWCSNISNIPNSDQESFSLALILNINNIIPLNNSPTLLSIPYVHTVIGALLIYNLAAYDSDGDSITYRLVNCIGNNAQEISGYELPLASNTININPITGDFIWDSPIDTGIYAIATIIEEWRQGIIIGHTLVQMTIIVESSTMVESIFNPNIIVYPNPFAEMFTIEGIMQSDNIKIFDIIGKSQSFNAISNQPFTICFDNINSGIYLLTIERKGRVKAIKVFKE